MQEVLEYCRARFGEAPRSFSLLDRLTYMRVPRPYWLLFSQDDDINTLFANDEMTYAEGRVTWGYIIQANGIMYEKGLFGRLLNCPGEVVYSLDDPASVDPGDLEQIAIALAELKGTSPEDPELSPIAEYLTAEWMRVFGLRVPTSISPQLDCRISTTFFVRKHLPRGRICAPLLPLVIYPAEPFVVMPLPARYWPEALVEWWEQFAG
jgi:hypothetical protein